eukprot:CAMPEP_0170503058 /NCGR_PEP_ID=MMETSP0208-20121228/43495_1 /TAXON_ID=197538 /ORGANISM="Strombidium inclinatum, Strain S3" /LENGTH=59 /DNA_ID=CAMNT_0010782503 /DNA_START=223 /DNA_END=402 /DNA_ORIENTATION=-
MVDLENQKKLIKENPFLAQEVKTKKKQPRPSILDPFVNRIKKGFSGEQKGLAPPTVDPR